VAHGTQHRHSKGLAGLELSLDLSGEVIRVIRELHILAEVAFLVHQGHEIIGTDVHEGVLLSNDVGDVGGVGGRNDIFVLLASEDINGSEVALGVSVLSSLGGGDGRDLDNKQLYRKYVRNRGSFKTETIRSYVPCRGGP
jgi:hypothetical protein